MNLEQIDTSTTAGKAEVMRLAAEGRRVAQRYLGEIRYEEIYEPKWDWVLMDYAIIAEPVGPEEVYVVVDSNDQVLVVGTNLEGVQCYGSKLGRTIVPYRRADLAGEKGE